MAGPRETLASKRQARARRLLRGTGDFVAPEELGLDCVDQRGRGRTLGLRTASGCCALPNLSPLIGS